MGERSMIDRSVKFVDVGAAMGTGQSAPDYATLDANEMSPLKKLQSLLPPNFEPQHNDAVQQQKNGVKGRGNKTMIASTAVTGTVSVVKEQQQTTVRTSHRLHAADEAPQRQVLPVVQQPVLT